MSILSMQKAKFKVSRTKSTFKLNSSFISGHLNSAKISPKKDSQLFCSIEGT